MKQLLIFPQLLQTRGYSQPPRLYTSQDSDQYSSHYSAQYPATSSLNPEQYLSQPSRYFAPPSSTNPDHYPSQSSQYPSQASSRNPDQGHLPDAFIERPSLSAKETSERIHYWNDIATRGGYDAATYIADPLAHYSWLEHLEEYVVRNSEYFQYRGDL